VAYDSSIKVLETLKSVKSLVKFKEVIRYAWGKTQTEACRYWQTRPTLIPNPSKLRLSEDARLMVVAYALV